MRIHYLQHVPFEDPAYILQWAKDKSHQLSASRLYQGDPLPELETFDWLIIMGGPMSVHDEAKYDWMKPEKQLVKRAIDQGKTVLGICLGAQFIAEALGAEVTPNQYQEIGWFPIQKSDAISVVPELAGIVSNQLTVFHWHGETFSLPSGAIQISSSKGCQCQGFVYNQRVIALQFHPEMTPVNVSNITRNCGDEIIAGPYTQSTDEMMTEESHFQMNHELTARLLDYLEKVSA